MASASSTLDCHACPVRNRGACSALSDQERHELARSGRIRQLARGETLFNAGQEAAACATLISGALKISRCDSAGVERILALIHPAGFIGELFTPFAEYDVTALTDSRLCVFSSTQFNQAVSRFPALGEALLRRAHADLHESRHLVDLISRRSAESKVAGLILALAAAASDSPCHRATGFELPLTRSEMAGLLGITIETVSRQLSKLAAKGFLSRSGARGIILLAPDRLAELTD